MQNLYNISVKSLSFAYKNTDKLILKDIDLEVKEGEFVVLLGQSGCGKSTFLRLLAGLETATEGEILLGGKPIRDVGLERGVVFQDYSLFPWFTAGKNILLALQQKYPRAGKKELIEKIRYYFNEVGLTQDVFDKYPNELSGGMKQRCAICRAFALDPPVLLMDEPFGALDAVTRARLQDMIQNLWVKEGKNRKTILFVTHDVEEALLLGTKIVLFGASPSQIIYIHMLENKALITRDALFEIPEMLELRNKLLHILNKDIEEKIGEKENE